MKKYGLIVLLFVIGIILVYLFGNNGDYIKVGKLYISEIVASNSYTIKNEEGMYSDYIELYNGYDYDIDLEGYYLSDSIVDGKKWPFKSLIIKAHEYKIVYASSLDKCENECHTNFKLSSEGETVSLLDKTGNIISRVRYPKLSSDTSFSFINKKYIITAPTPNEENKDDLLERKSVKDYPLEITEYMTHNKGVSMHNSAYYDFVEIYNKSENDINLYGISLSDSSDNLNKFILPNVTIKKHDYLVIYLTGGEETEGVYANFKLSDDDEKIVLSVNKEIIDEVNITKLEDNISYGKKDDKWLYFMTPTPGMENNTYGVESYGE